MKNILQFLNAGIFLISIFSSCTIEKRKYQPGYNIQWINSKPDTKRNDLVQNNKSVEGDKLLSAGKSDTDILLTDESATASQYNLIITKKHKNEKSNHHFNVLKEDCDTIYLKNGDEIKAKVTEISQQEIKYKKCEDINGQTFTLRKSEVFMIKYPNGTKDIISPDASSENTPKEKKQSGIFAILSLVFILAGIVYILLFSSPLALLLFLIAIVLATIGVNQKRKLWGLALAILLAIVVFLVVFAFSLSGSGGPR